MSTVTLTNIANGTTADATVVMSNFNALANDHNGNITNDNIAAGAGIAYSKLNLTGAVQLTDLSFTISSFQIPTGAIILWSGTVASVPSGWSLCDGTNGTPDLRDKMVICARQDSGGVAKTNVTGSLTQSGGSATANLAHTHSVPRDGWGSTVGIADGRIATRSDGGGGTLYLATGDNTSGSGGSATQSVLNPYYALAYIMKL